MSLNVRENGIHSLVEALRAFKIFHEKPNDSNTIFALKDSILRAQHALEVLFKDVLFNYNPVLLLEEDRKVKHFVDSYQKFLEGEYVTVLEESRTINLEETIKRLKKLGLLKIEDRDYHYFLESIKKLARYRNRLQHFSLSADPDVIARILGIVLPRAIDLLDGIPYHHPILGDVPFRDPIRNFLESNFPNAILTINLLRSNYDELIDQAEAFFKGKIFRNQNLELLITDHGTGFWGPSELRSKGFLNFQQNRLDGRQFSQENVFGITAYSANVLVSEPEYSGMITFPYEGQLKGDLDFHAELKFRKAEGFLVLPESEEEVTFLRDLSLTIDASLQYTAKGMKGGAHFDVREIQNSSGRLILVVTAIPRGYEGEKPKIVCNYESSLNEQNAPFRLHSFLEPDGTLKDQNRFLEWKINTSGNIVFE